MRLDPEEQVLDSEAEQLLRPRCPQCHTQKEFEEAALGFCHACLRYGGAGAGFIYVPGA